MGSGIQMQVLKLMGKALPRQDISPAPCNGLKLVQPTLHTPKRVYDTVFPALTTEGRKTATLKNHRRASEEPVRKDSGNLMTGEVQL